MNQPLVETDIDKVPLTELERWGGQWRMLYRQKRLLHDVSTKQIVYGQLFTLAFVFGVSMFLEANKEALLAIGTTLVVYPALSDMLSSNAAVLSISLHHDMDGRQDFRTLTILAAISKTLFAAILGSLAIGLLAGVIGAIFFDTSFLLTLRLASLSGLLAGLVGMPIMLLATFLIRRLKANPDDVTAPIETAIFSSLTLTAIMIVSRYV